MKKWIFLRGLVRESRHWGSFVQEFAATNPDTRVITLDLPGNGRACIGTSPASVGGMVEAYRVQLREMGETAPYCILAVSLGGMVATEWSCRYPDDVDQLVLINTSMRPISAFHQRLMPANYATILRLLVTHATPLDWESTILKLTCNHPQEDVLRRWISLREQSPVTVKNVIRQLWAAALYAIPKQTPLAATLVLVSTKDRLVSSDCSLALAAHWRVPLVAHPSAGHDLPLDDGPWVARVVHQWTEMLVKEKCHQSVISQA